MKKIYIFYVFLLFYNASYAQVKCSDADSDINYAYSHVKKAYDANNISHLQQYAHRSLEAFKRATDILKACGCDDAYNNSIDGIELLEKVDAIETYEDGRFYVKRAREIARQSIADLDNCNQISLEEEQLLDLEMAQSKLQEQQLELQQKQEQLKLKMVEQKQKEIQLEKEVLIGNYETAIASNLKTYNDALRIYGCNSSIEITAHSEMLFSKSNEEIKQHYINIIKKMTAIYLLKLDGCDAR